MSKPIKNRQIIRSEQTNQNLQSLLNNVLMIDFNYPVYGLAPQVYDNNENRQEQQGQKYESKFIKNLGDVEGLINTLKFLKLKDKFITKNQALDKRNSTISQILFCRPIKHNLKDEKVYWLMKNKSKKALNLDNPKGVLILPNNFIITVQRKYINLYQIQQDLSINLKDFDSSGLGKKFAFSQLRNIKHKNREYVLIFGNQKYQFKQIFLVLVFEVTRGRLRFIKKAIVAQKQVVSSTIIFENDPNSKQMQKFCLVIGGCSDNFENIHYSALKIPLHILLTDFLSYSVQNTLNVPFNNKRNVILSGKAIYFKQVWYILCSQQQTVNQITLQYGGPCKGLTKIDVKSQKLNLKQKIFFSEDSTHYVYEYQEDKIVFVDKNLELKQRSLNDLLYRLKQ